MPHGPGARKLRRRVGPRRALYRTLVADLIRHERVRTTEPKAKEVRILADGIITLAKKGSLHDRRRALVELPHKDAVRKAFDELAPRYMERPGGYTRVVKLGPRKGDAAPMALLELVE